MTDSSAFRGVRAWLVSDPNSDATGWQQELARQMRDLGAASVDVVGVQGVVGLTARSILEQGAQLLSRAVRVVLPGGKQGSAAEELVRARPDLVVTDQPGMLAAIDTIRETIRLHTLLVGLVPGWEAGAGWDRGHADAFLAPDPALLGALRRPWMTDAALRLVPPMVGGGFSRPIDRLALRGEFGIGDTEIVVLLDAANLDSATIDAVMYQVSLARGAVTPIFYSGRNREAAEALRTAARTHRVVARMFGWVAAIEEYLVAADLIVVANHSELLAPGIALGRPAIGLEPSLGATRPAREGALVALGGVSALSDMLVRVSAGGVASSHSAAAVALASTDGARHAAYVLSELFSIRSELLAAAPAVATPAPGAPGAPGPTGPRAFEEIGGGPLGAEDAAMSRTAARDRLAVLIREERKIEAEIAAFVRERDRWLGRAQLAQEQGAADLLAVAESNGRDFASRIAAGNERLAKIQNEKDVVRRRAAGATRGAVAGAAPADASDPNEARFREMEQRSQLDRLRGETPTKPDSDPEPG